MIRTARRLAISCALAVVPLVVMAPAALAGMGFD